MNSYIKATFMAKETMQIDNPARPSVSETFDASMFLVCLRIVSLIPVLFKHK